MHGPNGKQQASPPCGCDEEQALAVLTGSGEAARFLRGQMWQMTYFVLAAYAALAAAPTAIGGRIDGEPQGAAETREDVLNWVLMNLFCAVVALVTAFLASWHLWYLNKSHAKRLKDVYAAREKLRVVRWIQGSKEPKPGRLIWGLGMAVWIGVALALWINLSRIPWARVVAWICQSASAGP